MDRQARRKHFERLVELREAYRARGPEDSTSVVSIETMISRVERLLARPNPPILMLDERDAAN
jgi:hypothetical protein